MTVSHFQLKFKNDPFWPKLTQIWPKFGYIWLYRSSVCPLVPSLSRSPFITFSETLLLVRTWKGGKNVFLIIFIFFPFLAKNYPKLPILTSNSQNRYFSLQFRNFFLLSLVYVVLTFFVSRRSRWRPKDSRPYVRPSRCCSKTVHYFF